MEKHTIRRTIRIMMIISVLLMTLFLCGCRTRVTNNTDVTTTINDESGMLQEMYQMRRDELGSPVAESPLLKGRGSNEEEEIEYSEFGDPFANSETDNDSDFEEDDDEDSENDESDENESEEDDDEEDTSSNTSQPSGNQGSGTVKRPTSTSTSTTIRVTLDLNGNGAKCSTSSIKVKKGSKYGTLPTPTRSGYKFTGWYTSKSGGSKVTSNTKVTASKKHTIYAHWEKTGEDPKPTPQPDQPKKTYTITFNANAGEGGEGSVVISADSITVEEGGTYGELPTASRAKYAFTGWFTEAEGGSQVTSGSAFTGITDQTLYAHWEKDTFTWWSNEFDVSANSVDSESRIDVRIDDGDDTEEAFIKECKGNIAGEDVTPKVIVRFMKNYNEDDAAQKAEEIHAAYSETAPDASIVIVSDKALKGSKEEKLLYKMMVLDVLYGKGGDRIDEMAADLETSGNYPYVLKQEEPGA